MEQFINNNKEILRRFGLRVSVPDVSESEAVRFASRIDPKVDLMFHRDWSIRTAAHLFPESMMNMQAIDLGCGEGRWARFMAQRGASVLAFDMHSKVLDIARERSKNQPAITYKIASFENIKTLEGEFDIGIASYTFHNVSKIDKVLQGCSDILRDNGQLIVILRAFCFSASAAGPLDGYYLPVRFDQKYLSFIPAYSVEDYVRFAHNANFDVIQVISQTSRDCFDNEPLIESGIIIQDVVLCLRKKNISAVSVHDNASIV